MMARVFRRGMTVFVRPVDSEDEISATYVRMGADGNHMVTTIGHFTGINLETKKKQVALPGVTVVVPHDRISYISSEP